jgi:glucan phosphorylase
VPGNLILASAQRRRMVDEAMDAYVDWREESHRVWEAYERWLDAARADIAFACLAYVAALDREERAAEVYADLINRLESGLRTLPPSAPGRQRRASRVGRR